jgi:hypothetical protein
MNWMTTWTSGVMGAREVTRVGAMIVGAGVAVGVEVTTVGEVKAEAGAMRVESGGEQGALMIGIRATRGVEVGAGAGAGEESTAVTKDEQGEVGRDI